MNERNKKMKVWIVGYNSKVAKVIEESVISQKYDIQKISQRNTDSFKEIGINDAIIYLVSNTKTIIDADEYIEYIYSNCVLLTKFIISNNIKNNNFIYFSSAKVYNIFNDKNIHTENEKIVDIPNYNKLKHIAYKIIKLVENKKICNCECTELKSIIDEVLQLPKIKEYFPIYEYTKIISELIIEQLLEKAYILRPTYLYGDNEDKNVIYQLIKDSAEGKMIELSTISKDFIHYNTLISVVQKILNNKAEKIITINVSQGKNIDNDTLIYFIKEINNIRKTKSSINLIEKCTKEFVVNNDKLKELLNEKETENIEKSIRYMIYRFYIQEIIKLKILKEYIGGSFACSYLIEDKGSCYILKMSIGNGAENGNLKMINEAKQMKAIHNILQDMPIGINVPKVFEVKVCNDWTIIKEEYIEGETYTDIFYRESNITSLNEKLKMYCNLISQIYNMDRIEQKVDILADGIRRSRKRLKEVKEYQNDVELYKNLEGFHDIIINDKIYENPLNILDKIRAKQIQFQSQLGLCISGDSILDNIVLTSNKLYVLDSRGQDLTWCNDKPYFDPYYDFGKILFYFVGWSTIRKENFDLKTNNYTLINTKSSIKLKGNTQGIFNIMKYECLKAFLQSKDILKIDDEEEMFKLKIILMSGMHFLSDTYPRIVGKGKKPIDECYAEFLIGTILINNVYKYLEKKMEFKDILKIGE